jgi:hypothetical protein
MKRPSSSVRCLAVPKVLPHYVAIFKAGFKLQHRAAAAPLKP